MIRLGACLVLLATQSGCFIFGFMFGEKEVDPVYDLRGDKVLVLPFREGKLWYGESRHGMDLARNLSYALQSTSECNRIVLVDSFKAEEALADFAGEIPAWVEYGREAGATQVLVGEIHEFSMREPKMVGMLQASIHFTIEVYDCETGQKAFAHRLRASYPKSPETGAIALDFEQNEETVRQAMYRVASEEATKLLCGYLDKGGRR